MTDRRLARQIEHAHIIRVRSLPRSTDRLLGVLSEKSIDRKVFNLRVYNYSSRLVVGYRSLVVQVLIRFSPTLINGHFREYRTSSQEWW